MTTRYILDALGHCAGITSSGSFPANSTDVPPPNEPGVAFRFVNGTWVRPESETRITRLAFINRFTMGEWIAIDGAAASVPTIKYFLAQVNAARYIDLARDDVKMGVQLLAANGMLTEARAIEILAAPILAVERLDPVAI